MRFLALAAAMLGLSAQTLADTAPTPLDKCALLLPEGRTYTFKLEGSAVNNGHGDTKVQRKVSVASKRATVKQPANSKAEAKAAAKEKMEAFRHCLAKAL